MNATYNYEQDKLNLKVTEVTLLSEEEVDICGEHIMRYNDREPWYFYLRTPHENDEIGVAEENYSGGAVVGDPTSPDYEDAWEIEPDEDDEDDFGETVYGTGIRPMLRLETDEISDGTVLVAGDRVVIGIESFTYLSENILLLDHYLFDGFSYGIFDEDTNIYEDSVAKKKVDTWFEKNIKPYLG